MRFFILKDYFYDLSVTAYLLLKIQWPMAKELFLTTHGIKDGYK